MTRAAAVVLAAGGARRMGRTKQLLPFRGRSLLCHSVETAEAAGCSPVVVVVGSERERMVEDLAGHEVVFAVNREWKSGIGSSIRVGVHAVESFPMAVDALVVLLCDQPFVTPVHVERLVLEHATTGLSIVASQYAGVLGAPALFASCRFTELRTLPDETGAGQLIQRNARSAAVVPFAPAAIDLDTPADYSRWAVGGDTTKEVSYVSGL